MTTIRPDLSSAAQPQPKAIDPARLAAQKAFFAAALGQASGTTPAAAPTTAAPARSAPVREPSAAAHDAAPQRIPRPGSILDIRV